MKKLFPVLTLLLLHSAVNSQIIYDFESGNIAGWTEAIPGRWGASADSPLSGNYSLKHIFDNDVAGADQTGVRVKGLLPAEGTTTWQFKLRHGFNPSSTNNWAVFLMSDAPPDNMRPGGTVNGFAVSVNFTGHDDTLRLIRINGGTAVEVINSGVNWEKDIGTDSAAFIRIQRSITGEWQLELLDNSGSSVIKAEAADAFLPAMSWFGIYYKYIATRDMLLWFDDLLIDGVWYTDDEPPAIVSAMPVSASTLQVSLSEEVLPETQLPDNWLMLPDSIAPSSVTQINATTYILSFPIPFRNRQNYTLRAGYMCDLWDNCMTDYETTFLFRVAEPGEIIITEFMSRPAPSVNLPEQQYIELHNRSSDLLRLQEWRLQVNNNTVLLPDIDIDAGEYLVLCSNTAAASLSQLCRAIGVTSFPSLTMSSGTVIVYDRSGVMIHGIEYVDQWHDNTLKRAGGWSLEMIDTSYPFHGGKNYTSSVNHKGGTPGAPNSVSRSNPDHQTPAVTNIFPEDSLTLVVSFNRSIANTDPLKSRELWSGWISADVTSADILNRRFRITLNRPLERGVVYTMSLPGGIAGYCGREAYGSPFSFALAERAMPGDIRFNELLFDPWPDEYDFVELVNVSDKALDASRLTLVTVNTSTGSQSSAHPLSDEGRIILPGAYYVVTINRSVLINRYPSGVPENIFEAPSMPTLSRDRSIVHLYSRELELIDRVSYDKSMHFSLLSGSVGVSLEKITPDADSDHRSNWYSASQAAGWATPGTVNSLYTGNEPGKASVTMSGRRIIPNMEGPDQLLVMKFTFPSRENVLSVTIFDENGYLVRELADNKHVAYESSIIWDGSGRNGQSLREGIYIIYMSAFDSGGAIYRWRKVCALIYR